jgi:hypothetical protein
MRRSSACCLVTWLGLRSLEITRYCPVTGVDACRQGRQSSARFQFSFWRVHEEKLQNCICCLHHVGLSLFLHVTALQPLNRFPWNLILRNVTVFFFFLVSVKIGQQYRTLHMKTRACFCGRISCVTRWMLVGAENVSDKLFMEGNATRLMHTTFFPEALRFFWL